MSRTKTTKINLQRLEQIINWPSAFPLKLYLIEYTEYRMLFLYDRIHYPWKIRRVFSVNIYNVAYCNKSNIKKISWVLVAHTFNVSICQQKTGSPLWVQHQPDLQSKFRTDKAPQRNPLSRKPKFLLSFINFIVILKWLTLAFLTIKSNS